MRSDTQDRMDHRAAFSVAGSGQEKKQGALIYFNDQKTGEWEAGRGLKKMSSGYRCLTFALRHAICTAKEPHCNLVGRIGGIDTA